MVVKLIQSISFLGLVAIAIKKKKKHHDQKTWGENGLVYLINLRSCFPLSKKVGTGTQGRNLEARDDGVTADQYCILVFLPVVCLSCFKM